LILFSREKRYRYYTSENTKIEKNTEKYHTQHLARIEA